MNIGDQVKWTEVCYDSFSDPEEIVVEFSGTLMAIVTGWLGFGLVAVVWTECNYAKKVPLIKLRKK